MASKDGLFRNKVHSSPLYRDLRILQDDKRVLKNPHKGWYWHYIDNGYGRSNYREKVEYGDWLLDFPGLNHLYLRFDWSDIEKEEGKLDWSYIDEIMEKWGSKDYRFALRFVTYEAWGGIPFATPEWVYKAGAKGNFFKDEDGRSWEPDYGDTIYLEKLSAFMAAAGEKFNKDPHIETIDVGTYGTWGEGHTVNGSNTSWPLEVMKTHVNLHVKNFPDKWILLNDDHINNRSDRPWNENRKFLDYCIGKGLGLRDDSICVKGYAQEFGYDTLRSGWMFDYFWEQAPIDIEFEHYAGMSPQVFKSGFPFLAALNRTHATFAGFHGYPRPWLKERYDFTEYCANRLGYWYFLEGIEFSNLVAGLPTWIRFYWSNRGIAPAYWRYSFKIRLQNIETGIEKILIMDESDNRKWMPGEETVERLKMTVPDLKPGKYKFSIGLFEGNTSIQIGIREDLCKEGFYDVTTVEIEKYD